MLAVKQPFLTNHFLWDVLLRLNASHFELGWNEVTAARSGYTTFGLKVMRVSLILFRESTHEDIQQGF